MSKEYPWGKGTPTWTRDATANDSDKSFTVPAGKVRFLQSVTASIVTTATVGNRQLKVTVTDGTNEVWRSLSTTNIPASTTAYLDVHTASFSTTSTTKAGAIGALDSLPVMMLLPAGYVVRVWDTAAIDPAADDMTVVLHYVEYDA